MDDQLHIVFMRHGRSLADDEMVIEGRYDSPLTDIGCKQARDRAEELRLGNEHFDAIVASPLKRAAETARIIGDALNIDVEHDENWMEKDNGPLAGLSFEEARAKYPLPEFHNPFQPHVVVADAGESAWSFQGRAARALEGIIRRGPGKYLVVAHGGILSAALRCIVGAQPAVTGQGVNFSLGDTGFVRTRYAPGQHQWVISELRRGLETK